MKLLLLSLQLPMLPVELLLGRRLPWRPDHSAVVGVRAARRGGARGTRREVSSQPRAPLLVPPLLLLLVVEAGVAAGAHGGAVEAARLQGRRWTKRDDAGAAVKSVSCRLLWQAAG